MGENKDAAILKKAGSTVGSSYYLDKLDCIADIFGVKSVTIVDGFLQVGVKRYPILDDVIVVLSPSQYSPVVASRLATPAKQHAKPANFAPAVQESFGTEWRLFGQIEPEHQAEFEAYFDLVDLDLLRGQRVCDLGCGSGRWASFIAPTCEQLVAIDFSDAIFVARRNLSAYDNVVYLMADILDLPLRDRFASFIYCLGVLHHLPVKALDQLRRMSQLGNRWLVYLYYALDNRPLHFQIALRVADFLRRRLIRVRSQIARRLITNVITSCVYLPLLAIGSLFAAVGWGKHVPLYETYHGKSVTRIKQDVFDRFFTAIEQRVTRQAIMGLTDVFATVRVSDRLPYWHFVCEEPRKPTSHDG